MSNWDIIRQAMESRGCTLKKDKDGYRSTSPLRNSDNVTIFKITPDATGDNGVWYDFKDNIGGNFFQLAIELNVTLEDVNDKRLSVEDSKRIYKDLDDYATAHGCTGDFMRKAKWLDVTYYNRPALRFETNNGFRYRFTDGNNPPFLNQSNTNESYTTCWYYLDRAIQIADFNEFGCLIICNGEASVVSGQFNNIPAFCQTTSGEREIPKPMLDILKSQWQGRVLIAMDCDDKGRAAAQKIKAQLGDKASIIDMGLSDKGDLADFCKLHGKGSYKTLLNLSLKQVQDTSAPSTSAPPTMIDHSTDYHRSDQVRSRLRDMAHGKVPIRERSFPFPLINLHQFGGFMENCETSKVTLIMGGSGDGKTQLLETFNDKLNSTGVNGFFWGIEWTNYEMEMRRIQRYSGGMPNRPHVSYSTVKQHHTAIGFQQDGVDDMDNHGKLMSSSELQEHDRILDMLDTWRGITEYYGGEDTLEDTFDQMTEAMTREKTKGNLILYIIFDYAQLLKSKKWDNSVNRYEFAFEQVKKFAFDHNVHVFMTTQVNKEATTNVKEQGKSLNAASANFIRPDKSNLCLALNRQYYPDGHGNWVDTNAYWLTVLKSSMGGRPEGYTDKELRIPIVMEPYRLYFNEDFDWRESTADPYTRLADNFNNQLQANNKVMDFGKVTRS